MIPIPGTAYLLLAAFVAGAVGTYKVMDWKQRAEEATAIKISREIERGGVAVANAADKDYISRLTKQKESADERARRLSRALEIAGNSLRNCTVSPELVRLLNDSREEVAATRASSKPQPATPKAEASAGSSNCAAVIETYHWNIDNVVEPNRLQVEGLQKFYNDLRMKFNAAGD